jgi:hypothetical protein
MIIHFIIHLTILVLPFCTLLIFFELLKERMIEKVLCDEDYITDLENGDIEELDQEQFGLESELKIFTYTCWVLVGFAFYEFLFEFKMTYVFTKLMDLEYFCCYNILKLLSALARRLTQYL